MNPSQAHNLANEIFRRWYDLHSPERTEQKVTIVDDQRDVYREDDLKRLGDYSAVVPVSDQDGVRTLLAA